MTSSTAANAYPFVAPDFGGVDHSSSQPPQPPSSNESQSPSRKTHDDSTSTPHQDDESDPMYSVTHAYNPPSTPQGLPPHVPTPPALKEKQQQSKQLGADSKDRPGPEPSSQSPAQSTTSTQSIHSQFAYQPPITEPPSSTKKGDIDLGYLEKVGNTTKIMSTPNPSTNVNSANTPTDTKRGTSGKPQKGDPGYEEPHEEEQGAARGEAGNNVNNNTEDGEKAQGHSEYPPQKHAGHVDGVGPEYDQMHRATLGDKLQGVKEKVKGAITRNPDLKQQGHERMTGELKKKQQEEEEKKGPFGHADDKKDQPAKSTTAVNEDKPANEPAAEKTGNETETLNNPKDVKDTSNDNQAEAGLSDVPQAHPTEKGKVEQAANVAPEQSGPPNPQEQKARDTAAAGEITSS